jgi:type I restriction enzyme M protein
MYFLVQFVLVTAFITSMNAHFAAWRETSVASLKALKEGCHPKQVIAVLAENLLAHYANKPLIDPYDIYQHLMDYWAETMQDDCYLIAADGWKAETSRILETDKKGRQKDKGWICDLVPKALLVARYFASEQATIDKLAADLENVTAKLAELEEEQLGDEDAFSEARSDAADGKEGKIPCDGELSESHGGFIEASHVSEL